MSRITTSFPESPTPKYDGHIKLEANSAIVIGDCEIPDHDKELFAMAAEIGTRLGIQTLIINGDLVDCDAFSRWTKIVESGQRFSKELDLAKDTIQEFLRYFRRIFIVSGNHDRRIAASTNGQVWMGMFLNDIEGVEFSEYSFMEMHSCAGKWIINHPKNYSKIPLSTARELASIYHSHILCGHNHHLAQGLDKSGLFHVVDGGCCRDPLRTAYRSYNIATYPHWSQGFVVIKDGRPVIISKDTFSTMFDLLGK